jgi:hypothetical protein
MISVLHMGLPLVPPWLTTEEGREIAVRLARIRQKRGTAGYRMTSCMRRATEGWSDPRTEAVQNGSTPYLLAAAWLATRNWGHLNSRSSMPPRRGSSGEGTRVRPYAGGAGMVGRAFGVL